jgi:hypothetical protein
MQVDGEPKRALLQVGGGYGATYGTTSSAAGNGYGSPMDAVRETCRITFTYLHSLLSPLVAI